mgnify:CR=1 FL=1
MRKFYLLLSLMLTFTLFSQDKETITKITKNDAEIIIPGSWEMLNTMDDSGQTYFQNNEKVIIAISLNPKKAYSFYKAKKSDFDNLKLFYKWDSDYRKDLGFKTGLIKENKKQEYIIWRYNDNEIDNVFLFSSVKNNFINLLVYTNTWS